MVFPLWWYGSGLIGFVQGLRNLVRGYVQAVALSVWMRHLFVPMYGDESFVGRVMSFCLRLIMIVVRLIGLIVLLCGVVVLLVMYVVLPPLLVWAVVFHSRVFF